MTGIFIILWHIFEKIGKKSKTSFFVNLTKNFQKLCFFGSCDFNFNFFEFFSKMRQTISTLSVILSFIYFFCGQNFYNSFISSIVENLNIFPIYKSIVLISSVNLTLVFIYKFYKKEIQI